MSKKSGFLQLRRGVFAHVRDGRMSVTECLAFIYICSEADTRTGIWKGCAKSLSGELGIPDRTARDVLEKMEHGDYIRRFAVPGRHACYPILIHKYPISQGEHNGEQLNAVESKSPAELSYFPREHNGEHGVQRGVEYSAAQRIRDTRNKKQTPSSPSAPLVGFEVFWKEYPKHEAKKKAEAAWRKIPLSEHPAIMAAVMIRKQTNEWLKEDGRYVPHAATFLHQERWKDSPSPALPSRVAEIPILKGEPWEN